jgi:hypothetical protein
VVTVVATGYLLTVRGRQQGATILSPVRPAASATPAPTPTPIKKVARPRTSPADFQAGLSILVYGHDPGPADAFGQLLDEVVGDDVNSLAIAFPVYTDGPRSNRVHPGQDTPSDASLTSLVKQAKARGFSIMLRPVLDESSLPPPMWRGQIEPASPSAWFASYSPVILDYARMAQQDGVDSLEIGAELTAMESNVAGWSGLISQVRQVYSGQVTYAFNWGSSFQTGFWPQLDFVSIDAYFPLDRTPAQASVAQMAADWQRWLDLVRRTNQPYGKPIVFTEIGLVPKTGAQQKPWNRLASTQFDLDAQRAYYEAACSATTSTVAGLYWWSAGPTMPANLTPDDYSPLGRPAEGTMHSCYARVEGLVAPSPAATP